MAMTTFGVKKRYANVIGRDEENAAVKRESNYITRRHTHTHTHLLSGGQSLDRGVITHTVFL